MVLFSASVMALTTLTNGFFQTKISHPFKLMPGEVEVHMFQEIPRKLQQTTRKHHTRERQSP